MNGVGVSTASGNQNWPAIVDDGAGGEIITWMDGRGSNNHIYAQKVDRYGKLGITGVEDNSLLPKTTALMQSYPNPFNPTTVINFQLSDHSYTNLKIFDIIGREVTTLVSETLPAGTYTRQWNASGMSSGIYFYRLQVYPNVVGAGSFTETKKLVLLK
jgi:hypothetical protein